MKTLAAFAVSLLIAVTASAQISGAWTAEWEGEGKLQLNLMRHGHQNGETMNAADFSGLPAGVVGAAAKTPVNFELRREAGTIAFEGTFLNGYGAGQFTFTPNATYTATLGTLGVTFDDGVDDNHLMSMALLDVSTDYIRAMQAAGYHESGNRYAEMRIFKITPEYVRDMRAAGYSDLTARELVESSIHEATPEFINSLKAVGYEHVPFRQLIEFRIHRVTPEFIQQLRDAGYDHVPPRKLVEMRIHGITPEYIKQMNGSK